MDSDERKWVCMGEDGGLITLLTGFTLKHLPPLSNSALRPSVHHIVTSHWPPAWSFHQYSKAVSGRTPGRGWGHNSSACSVMARVWLHWICLTAEFKLLCPDSLRNERKCFFTDYKTRLFKVWPAFKNTVLVNVVLLRILKQIHS